jgi:hypothetical protein
MGSRRDGERISRRAALAALVAPLASVMTRPTPPDAPALREAATRYLAACEGLQAAAVACEAGPGLADAELDRAVAAWCEAGRELEAAILAAGLDGVRLSGRVLVAHRASDPDGPVWAVDGRIGLAGSILDLDTGKAA